MIANQITEACGWEQAPRYLIRDRDGAYGDAFVRRLRSMGIRDRPTSPRSPWQNGYAERLIGSIRRECVDHIVVLGERHLRQVLLSYMKYYNEIRTHLSLDKDAPVPRPSVTFFAVLSWAGCITNIPGFDLRQAQASSCFAWEGCTKQTPDRALRRHCRTCNLGRIASPVRTNLVFGSDTREALAIVRPDTVVRWHRAGFRLFWRWKSRSRPGRPAVPAEIRQLIRQMSVANPLWGAPRIHGELLKLGIDVGQTSVAKYMVRRRGLPSRVGRRSCAIMRMVLQRWICSWCRPFRFSCSMGCSSWAAGDRSCGSVSRRSPPPNGLPTN